MPEMPELQAHAERLTADFAGRRLRRFTPLVFTALKTAVPAPDVAYGSPLEHVGRRGQVPAAHVRAGDVRRPPDAGRAAARRREAVGQATRRPGPLHVRPEGAVAAPALLLTEQGTERRAGVWCVPTAAVLTSPPLDKLGPEAATIEPDELAARFAALPSTRIHGFLRDQRAVAGIGRRLANEVCHRAKLSPFAMTRKLGLQGATAVVAAIREVIAEDLADERGRDEMSSSKDRSAGVHGRAGEPCPVCGDTIRAVEYSSYTVEYCPTCQTGGKVLADNTTSKFLK